MMLQVWHREATGGTKTSRVTPRRSQRRMVSIRPDVPLFARACAKTTPGCATGHPPSSRFETSSSRSEAGKAPAPPHRSPPPPTEARTGLISSSQREATRHAQPPGPRPSKGRKRLVLPNRRGVACAVQACGQAAHGYRDAELCEGRGGLSRSHHRQPPEPVSVFAHVRLEGLDGLGPSPGICRTDYARLSSPSRTSCLSPVSRVGLEYSEIKRPSA